MKIGILTLPLVSNNGGILQAFALQKYLHNLGHEAILLDRRHRPSKLINVKQWIVSKLFNRKYISRKEYLSLNQHPFNFISKYINPKSQHLLSGKELAQFIDREQIDAVIVGSDQVWRLDYSGKVGLNFFLDIKINRKIKKISYAASFGRDYWNENTLNTIKVRKLLKKFDAISVREETGVNICANVFGVDAKWLIDPTLLINKQDYVKIIIQEKEAMKRGQLFYYFLDETDEKINFALDCAKKLAYSSYSFEMLIDVLGNNKVGKVSSWLRCFMDAKFVITDSFHGCVFSIIFNKPFIAIGNIERGLSRFESLLRLFDLEECLILNTLESNFKLLEKKFNFDSINSILTYERQKAQKFFNEELFGCF